MKNVSFIRKVVYLVLMAALLIPLYLISAPSFSRPDGNRSEGGLLTQMREKHQLSQANLGEIDPASESMKLATLGMRGVAANLLWNRAAEYKKKEQWDNLRATLNQIAKLQPNFVLVWQHQAWNLSYNVSVEFDNYKHRYHWVKKGIDFLMEGIRYNNKEPRLLWDLGWFFGHKVGRSDEYKQFREEFRNDEDFHNSFRGHIKIEDSQDFNGKPDNWLTSHQWYVKAQNVVDLDGVTVKGKNPLVFHSYPGKSLIRYGEAIEEEGTFDDYAKEAWREAFKAWDKYGSRDIPTSYGYTIQLNDGEAIQERIKADEAALDGVIPGLREDLIAKEKAQMPPEELALLDVDLAKVTGDAYMKAKNAKARVEIKPEEMLEAIRKIRS